LKGKLMPEQMQLDFDRSPVLNPEERRVYGLLSRGRESAIREKTLTTITGISGVRIRTIIKHLIEDHGIMIVSSTANPPGFYLPENRDEYRQGVVQLVHRIASLARRVRAMDRQYYEQILGGSRLPL